MKISQLDSVCYHRELIWKEKGKGKRKGGGRGRAGEGRQGEARSLMKRILIETDSSYEGHLGKEHLKYTIFLS